MKLRKCRNRLLAFATAMAMVASLFHTGSFKTTKANATGINDAGVFLSQYSNGGGGGYCTLASNVNMLRRYALLRGDSDWSSITLASSKGSLWPGSMKLDYTYKNISVKCYMRDNGFVDMADKASFIAGQLASHPEGIVLYDHNTASCAGGQHAVLVTDYTDGVFYCADPADSNPVRKPMSSSIVKTIQQCEQYWIVVSGPVPTTEVPGDNPGSPYPIPSGNLTMGSRGDSVKWVQKFANDVLGAGIAEDGIYGNDTEYAVRYFQQNNGLTADGICGAQTTAKMLEVWRKTVVKHEPYGYLDAAQGTDDGKLYVYGWAVDNDDNDAQLRVHIYVGGPAGSKDVESYEVVANKYRKDVGDVIGRGAYHGFSDTITTSKKGTLKVYAYAINVGAGGNNMLDSSPKTVTIKTTTTTAVTTTTEKAKTTQAPTTAKPATTQAKTTEVATTRANATTKQPATTRQPATTKETVTTEQPRATTERQSATTEASVSNIDDDDTFDVEDFYVSSPSIKKLTNVKKRAIKLTVKQVNNADGYEYVIAKVTKKSLKSFKKEIKNADDDEISFAGAKYYSSKAFSVKLKSLKKNKKYAIAVRAYKIIDGEKYYSDYSSVKTIKIKR